MYSNLNIYIIGDGVHSKRIQDILIAKKIKFEIFKPKNKVNFVKEKFKQIKNI